MIKESFKISKLEGSLKYPKTQPYIGVGVIENFN